MKHITKYCLILLATIVGCNSAEPEAIPAEYNFYFNITNSGSNIFQYSSYNIDMTGYRAPGSSETFAFTDDFKAFSFQDSLFKILAANTGGPSIGSPLILDFGNNDYDTIAIDRNHPKYDIYYNDQLVQTYDLGKDEFEKEFWDRNKYSFRENENPIIITVEKRLEVQ